MRERIIEPDSRHQEFRNELLAVLQKHGASLKAEEILAVTCQLVGQIIAMQDQRRYSSDAIMLMVSRNIEAGNKTAIDQLLNAPGGTA